MMQFFTKKENVLIGICFSLATLLKIFFFLRYNFITDDDFYSYLPLSKNIFDSLQGAGTFSDTVFPPGYPFLLGLEKLLFGSFEAAFFFNYVLVTSLTSLVIFYLTKKFIDSAIAFFLIPLIFLYPL